MSYLSVDETLAQKKEIKKKVYKGLSLKYPSKKPLISIIADGELSESELALIRGLNEAGKDIDVDFLILAESGFDGCSRFQFVPYNLGNREMVLEASDFVLAFKFNDIEEIMMHGAVPICKNRAEVENYDAQTEKGNAFIYKNDTVFSVFEASVRAIETYKFPWDFKHIVRTGMKIGV